MTRHPRQTVLAFLVALAVVSGGVHLLQQWLYARAPLARAEQTTLVAPAPAPAPVAAPEVALGPTTSRGATAGRGAAASVPATTGLATSGTAVDAGWLTTTAAAAGVPVPALNAYARAALTAPEGCSLGWTTLAGIGWVESHHGTIGERTLGLDGHASSRILGPALDGAGPVAAIRATPETTAYHGNPEWDHAVGPLQFIPSTWETWGADGDGDGLTDPNDLDDAARAAAGYLCADGNDMASAEGWTAGVFSYNHSDAYVADVHAAAVAYAERTAG